MTLSRRQLIGMAAAGGLIGIPKIADLLVNRSSRDPSSWDIESIPATTLPLTPVLDFSEFTIDGWELHDVTAGPSQDLLVLLGKRHWNLEWDPKLPLRPWQDRRHVSFDIPGSYRIIHQHRDGTRTTMRLKAPTQDYWWVQPLGREGYLLVSAWTPDGGPGAHVYDPLGQFVRSFPIGDGIDFVQTTASGDIWVGYGDTGIFGDDPLSQSGTICFDRMGNVRFRLNKPPYIDETFFNSHTYAMNVPSDSEAWLFYYTEFPVVRIRNHKIDRVWRKISERSPISGAGVFAIDRDRLLFGGGYRDLNSLYLIPLSGDSFQRFIATADGALIDTRWGFARGSWLYLWTDDALYGIDASTLPPLD